MKVADFFCGAGGFSEGFRIAGFDVVFSADNWGPAVITHTKNHPEWPTKKVDIELLSKLPDDEFHNIVPDTDVIIGSPPCVAFSNSNKSGKADKSLGIRLFEAYLRIIARKKFKKNSVLKYWILENVPNASEFLKSHYTAQDLELDGNFILEVKSNSSGIYNSKYYGVAQNRRRYFCGEFPKPQETILNDEEVIPLSFILRSLNKVQGEIKDPNYPELKMLDRKINDHFYVKELADFEWKKAKKAKRDKGYMGKMAFPESLDKPSRTIMATLSYSSRESHIYKIDNEKDRYRTPTIREAASIMSFPIDYKFYGDTKATKHKLVGNAVPPKLAYAFAKEIIQTEGEQIPPYPKTSFRQKKDEEFVNLNYNTFPVNIEKRKNLKKARYKYHIPYLILNTYRVELTNYNSDFENEKIKWTVELHKSQGAANKRVYTPGINYISNLDLIIRKKIEKFLKRIQNEIVNPNQFQEFYCMTSIERKENEFMGPDELLEEIKKFIEEININDEELSVKIKDDGDELTVPWKIAIGYFILFRVVEEMNLRAKSNLLSNV
ncbi:DNA cytosine methyltransferase [Sediminibacillus sp. JSM 1682029]|uniref:DNA cytosine methyltransferase n=1 Tax=Sediminibacillus sp. JSM 1682029 TaxID=3229857 RepID=UPI0035242AF8